MSELVHLTKNQILWAVREEMAMTVEDVLARRTRTLFLNAEEARNLAIQVAEIMAEEMQASKAWIDEQVKNFISLTKNYQIS